MVLNEYGVENYFFSSVKRVKSLYEDSRICERWERGVVEYFEVKKVETWIFDVLVVPQYLI